MGHAHDRPTTAARNSPWYNPAVTAVARALVRAASRFVSTLLRSGGTRTRRRECRRSEPRPKGAVRVECRSEPRPKGAVRLRPQTQPFVRLARRRHSVWPLRRARASIAIACFHVWPNACGQVHPVPCDSGTGSRRTSHRSSPSRDSPPPPRPSERDCCAHGRPGASSAVVDTAPGVQPARLHDGCHPCHTTAGPSSAILPQLVPGGLREEDFLGDCALDQLNRLHRHAGGSRNRQM